MSPILNSLSNALNDSQDDSFSSVETDRNRSFDNYIIEDKVAESEILETSKPECAKEVQR